MAEARNPSPDQPVYWDRAALREETTRILDICHGCRRCVHLCPSFTNVFKRIDAIEDQQTAAAGGKSAAAVLAEASTELKEEGHHAAAVDPSLALLQNPVEALTDADHQRVVDECFHCGLCFDFCPYHPPHRFSLDFPKLMRRHAAVGLKEGKGRFRDRLFAQVDVIGAISGLAAPIVNRLNSWRPHRLLLRAVLGVHPDRNLPLFHFETFRRWWDARGPKARANGRVVLFYTCSVNYNEPRIGKAMITVLEKNGFEVVCPPQECCGMPHLDYGNHDGARAAAERNVRALLPYAQQGLTIIALGPTCSMMLKKEYPELLKTEACLLVAKQTKDAAEFLMHLKKQGRLNLDFKAEAGAGKVAYQPACHLKNQSMGLKSKELLELLPGTAVSVVDRCSGHDGTWSMKEENYELSMKYAKKLFDGLEQAGADTVSTDCPLAGLQIAQGTGRAPVHPIELVAKAYGDHHA
jgi:Fe-S oxidoreductase